VISGLKTSFFLKFFLDEKPKEREIFQVFPLIYEISIFPKFISNFFYKIVAKNRYKIFGKKDSCYVPTEEELKKFIT